MSSRTKVLALLLPLAAMLLAYAFWSQSGPGSAAPGPGGPGEAATAAELQGDAASRRGEQAPAGTPDRATLAQDPESIIGVRGVVLDARTRKPMPGVEVVALRLIPSLERPITRLRTLFTEGIWTDTSKPVEVLASAVTAGDGTFEMYGLPPGHVFLDARSERAYVRNPGSVRLARGQVEEGVELLASPGGRIVGRVFGPEGAPATNTRVSVRPGLNAFLGQLTQRKYKWLEADTDAEGRFVIAGVPTGDGYSVTFAAPDMALQERHGIDIAVGETVEMTVHATIGASVAGRVVDGEGNPVAGAQIAMIYLDVSRMIFSADGRDEPITTDANGAFGLSHVAPGRVAFIAAADHLAPSNIHELAVVDGGVYGDVLLTLDPGRSFTGIVVDQDEKPLAGVDVEIRPMDDGGGGPQQGGDAMKLALKIRRARTATDAAGRFTTTGIAGDRLMMQFSKSGYITVLRTGAKVDQKDFRIVLSRGVTVHGKVQLADGTPVTRFRVEARSREERGDAAQRGERPAGEARAPDADAESQVRVEVGARPGGRGRGGPFGRDRTVRMREGATLADRGMGAGWDEVKDAAGRFSVRGVPGGKVRVRVRAEGFLEPQNQDVVLAPGQESEELLFVVERGAVCRGVVRDAASGAPVAEAMVSAYRAKEADADDQGGMQLFRPNADAEDFDFLGLSGREGRSSAMTDGKGEFEISGLAAGDYRLTARHPDMAKASVKDIALAKDQPAEGIEILLESGGTIEGLVTGKGKLPLASAMVVAFSIQAGAFKSDATDERGFYRIEGLPPGQYIVFKSRMDERTQDIGMDLMSNMRIKTTTVRKNDTTRKDIHDEGDDTVRVFGVVRDAGKPLPRAVVTFLGRDREGFLGMGIRTKPTGEDGSYEMIGVDAGDYLVQIARFRDRPEQSNLTAEIPSGVREFRLDIDLPQSYLEGVVQDSAGSPVAGVQVQVGLQDDAPIDGIVGIILKNGIAQARTDDAGRFKVQGLAAGTYRLTASGGGIEFARRMGITDVRGRRDSKWGEVALADLQLDGVNPRTGLVLTLPRAGSIRGVVVDGTGQPIAKAELHVTSEDRARTRAVNAEKALTDLFGLQIRPVVADAEGRFAIEGLSPGTYGVRADVGEDKNGAVSDVVVAEGQPTEVRITVIQGATLHLRVRNIDGGDLPLASVSVFDSKGKPLASKVSVLSVFRRYMRGEEKKDSSGWHEVGGIPPDTYTIVIEEKGRPELRIVRTVRDGEEARWDIDMAAELEQRKATK